MGAIFMWGRPNPLNNLHGSLCLWLFFPFVKRVMENVTFFLVLYFTSRHNYFVGDNCFTFLGFGHFLFKRSIFLNCVEVTHTHESISPRVASMRSHCISLLCCEAVVMNCFRASVRLNAVLTSFWVSWPLQIYFKGYTETFRHGLHFVDLLKKSLI